MPARTAFYDLLTTAPDPADDAFRPSRVSAAAAHALGAAGASLCLQVRELRLPLGASDADAALAESGQFTVGDGPCLEAIRTGTAIDATAADLDRRWPELAARWRDETPFRSAASFPVVIGGALAALNVYLRSTRGRAALDLDDADTVVSLISNELDVPAAGQAWESRSPRSRRGRVWIAIGLLCAERRIDADQALQLLRGYARERDSEVDRVSQQLVDGSLRVEQITG